MKIKKDEKLKRSYYELEFKCTICEKTFTQSGSSYRHVKRNHNTLTGFKNFIQEVEVTKNEPPKIENDGVLLRSGKRTSNGLNQTTRPSKRLNNLGIKENLLTKNHIENNVNIINDTDDNNIEVTQKQRSPAILMCIYCKKKFNKSIDKTRHERKNHPIITRRIRDKFRCTKCRVSSNDTNTLLMHYNDIHTDGDEKYELKDESAIVQINKERYQCSSCEYGANQSTHVRMHLMNIHKVLVPAVSRIYTYDICENCDATIKPTKMKEHLEFCMDTTLNKETIKYHNRRKNILKKWKWDEDKLEVNAPIEIKTEPMEVVINDNEHEATSVDEGTTKIQNDLVGLINDTIVKNPNGNDEEKQTKIESKFNDSFDGKDFV